MYCHIIIAGIGATDNMDARYKKPPIAFAAMVRIPPKLTQPLEVHSHAFARPAPPPQAKIIPTTAPQLVEFRRTRSSEAQT